MLSRDALKTARLQLGESQAAFGRRFGVDQSTIQRWEAKGPPKRGTAAMTIERVLTDLSIPRAGEAAS